MEQKENFALVGMGQAKILLEAAETKEERQLASAMLEAYKCLWRMTENEDQYQF